MKFVSLFAASPTLPLMKRVEHFVIPLEFLQIILDSFGFVKTY